MTETCSQADYAEKRGVTRQYINKLVAQWRIPVDDDKRVIVAEADLVPMGKDEDADAPQSEKFSTSQASKAEAEAKLAWLKYERETGRLVDKAEADHRVQEIFGDLRELLITNLPPRVAPMLAAKTDEREVLWALRTSLEEELTKFATRLTDRRTDVADGPVQDDCAAAGGPVSGESVVAAAAPAAETVG